MNEIGNRVAKCHGYDGYIRVKILAGWGKSLGEQTIWQNQAFFGVQQLFFTNILFVSFVQFKCQNSGNLRVMPAQMELALWDGLNCIVIDRQVRSKKKAP